MKKLVPGISDFRRKIELRGQEASSRALDFEMEMACSAGIKRRYDGVEPPAPLGIGKLVAPQAETDAVVVAVLVGMPDLDETAG